MDPELEKFKSEISLAAFAESHGFEISRKHCWRGSLVMKRDDGEKIIITRAKDGHWMFYSVKSDASGTILDFTMRYLNVSMGEARKVLRSFTGTPSAALAAYPPLVAVPKDRIRVQRAYEGMEVALRHPYLENQRCIPREILASRRFAGRVRTNAYGSAVFGHFDADGLTGFEMKGPGFTGFSSGGTKSIWISREKIQDNRIAFCESGVDALSLAALQPDERTRYASLAGRISPAQRELIQMHAGLLPPSGTVVAAFDADASGREMAEIVRECVRLTGRGDLRFEIQEPKGAKDWNDLLRMRKATSPLPYRSDGPSIA